jgi:hypothetical protein
MKEARLEVTDDSQILQYYRDLYSKVHGIPAHFVLEFIFQTASLAF